MKKLLIGLFTLLSISSYASVIKLDCQTKELTTSGDYFTVKAQVVTDYELNNVIFATKNYSSQVVVMKDPWGPRNLTVGAYTSFETYTDSLYSIALYLPAYKETYEYYISKSIIGSVSMNDFRSGVYGKNYKMVCKISEI